MSKAFLEAVRDGALVLDGGMGTELYDRGVPFSESYEDLCVSRPEIVLGVHEDFVRAGADVLETNTFGANRVRLARFGLEGRVRELNAAAVVLARRAAGERVYVAGAMGPTGLALAGLVEEEREGVREAFREQAAALFEAGVDALLLETIRQPEELELAIEGVRIAVGRRVPLVAQVSVGEDLALAGGADVATVGARLRDLGADVIGVNCSEGPESVLGAVQKLLPIGLPVSAAPSAGLPRRVGDRFVYAATPEDFAVLARRLLELGVRLIGGCCGTTPAHIRAIAALARVPSRG